MSSSTGRAHAAAIALVAGLYALVSAAGAGGTASGWLLALLGVVMVVHGTLLVSPYADRLGAAGGPLTIGYALVWLLDLALVGTTGTANWGMGGGMGPGMGDGPWAGMDGGTGSGIGGGPGWALGTLALAVLLLVSGVLQTGRTPDDAAR